MALLGSVNKLKTIFTNVCRLLLAITLILSGYVKAIDPLGTQYKIQDYLAALSWQGMVSDWITLAASVMLSALEFCMGVFTLLAIQRRIVSKITLFLMIIMTFISIWLVIDNPISNCGCFGDAIKLTNTETLLKNIAMLFCAIVLATSPLRMWRFISKTNQWIVFNYTILFILISSFYCLYKLPVFDFRPYCVGTNILKGMEIPKNAEQPTFKTTFLMKKNGITKEFTLDNYPDSTWQFVDSKTIQLTDGYIPPIHDFSIQTQNGEDLTEQILTDKGYTFLLVSPHLEKASDLNFGNIDRIYEYAQAYHYPLYCLTASTNENIKHWQDLTGAEYPFYKTDETALKTMIRSNPGLLLLKNGTIIRKWSHNDLPKEDQLQTPLNETVLGTIAEDGVAKRITQIFLWFILPLLLLTVADRLWAWSKWLRFKNKEKTAYKKVEKENSINS